MPLYRHHQLQRAERNLRRDRFSLPIQLCGNAASKLAIQLSEWAVRAADHCWRTAIQIFTQRNMQRHLPQESAVVFLQQLFRPAGAKDRFIMATVAANMHAHILYNAQYRHLHFLKHYDALGRIQQRDVLRRGDYQRVGHRNSLRQR